MNAPQEDNTLLARRFGIFSPNEALVFLREDCPICKSEGLTPHTRVRLNFKNKELYATLYQVTSDLLQPNEIGISNAAWSELGLCLNDHVKITHAEPPKSLKGLRGKIFGKTFDQKSAYNIIADIVDGRLSDIHQSSFVTAWAASPFDLNETIAFTRAMVDTGTHLQWQHSPIVDKHCIGGLPGNRTTPIIVSIVTANGLTMPKTSSRAITSPAGTADTMETLTRVDLTEEEIRAAVDTAGGCFVWGGRANMSPSDDKLIRIERALEIDATSSLIASIISKKIAAGATHLVIDIPVGPTAKVRSQAAALSLKKGIKAVARAFQLTIDVVITDGRQPVGRGIGPSLEARDVLAVLKGTNEAPQDLVNHAVQLAGRLLEIAGAQPVGEGQNCARETLASGRAWTQFQKICKSQGGLKPLPSAQHTRPHRASKSGRIASIDNRKLARLAKLAGAPDNKVAGLDLHVRLGDRVSAGDYLFTLHTQSPGELAYALDYIVETDTIVEITD